MASIGILGFLAGHFKVPPEVVATEGLCYLLQQYPAAREVAVTALAAESIPLETRGRISFISQARSEADAVIVDLEGRDGKRERPVLSIEGKLGAPLQDSQPVKYADRLEDGGSLLFVCPAQRISRLSRALWDRVEAEQMLDSGAAWKPDAAGIMWVALTRNRRLGITSWTALLDLIKDRAETMTPELTSDIHQLEGLVARYERELLSWTTEELKSGGFGLTFGKAQFAAQELCKIVSRQTNREATPPAWHTTGGRATTAADFQDWYGTWVGVTGAWITVGFEPRLWGDGIWTPLRIWFDARKLSADAAGLLFPVYLQMRDIANELLHQMLQAPPAAAWDQDDDWWMLPFPLRPEISSKEARAEMEITAATLLAPLVGLEDHPREDSDAASG
jgi:hypothetical protein